jgi:Bacteriocin-protection, YdeI or OmpD-Associated/Domain of unknown function (DUF1905)
VRFSAELRLGGKTATGIEVPAGVLADLGGGKRPAVAVTLNGHTFRTTVGSSCGMPMIPVSAAVRAAAGVSAGEVLEVEIEADTAPRVIEVPADLAGALAGNEVALAYYGGLSYSHQKAWVTWVEEARQPATRARRVEQTVASLAQKQPRR